MTDIVLKGRSSTSSASAAVTQGQNEAPELSQMYGPSSFDAINQPDMPCARPLEDQRQDQPVVPQLSDFAVKGFYSEFPPKGIGGGFPSSFSIRIHQRDGSHLDVPVMNESFSPAPRTHQIISRIELVGVESRPVTEGKSGAHPGWPEDAHSALNYNSYRMNGRDEEFLVNNSRIFFDAKGTPIAVSPWQSHFSFRQIDPMARGEEMVKPVPLAELIDGPEVLGARLARLSEQSSSPKRVAELQKTLTNPRITDILEAAVHKTAPGIFTSINNRYGMLQTDFAVHLRTNYPEISTTQLFGAESVAVAKKLNAASREFFGAKGSFRDIVNSIEPDTLYKAAIAYDHMYADPTNPKGRSLLETIYKIYGGQDQQQPDPISWKITGRNSRTSAD
jgi:hypothetical protein